MSGASPPPFPKTHRGKANCNGSVRVGLDGLTTPSSDWKVIIDFYEALHWIETYLGTKHPSLRRRESYGDTQRDVQTHLRSLYNSYFGLLTASFHFRYQLAFAEPIDVQKADSHAKRIRDHVKQALNLP